MLASAQWKTPYAQTEGFTYKSYKDIDGKELADLVIQCQAMKSIAECRQSKTG